MSSPELRGLSRQGSIDRHDLHDPAIDELLDGLIGTGAQRSHECLGIGARGDEPRVLARKPRPQARDGLSMVSVQPFEEADHHVGVEDYRSHSSRSSSR